MNEEIKAKWVAALRSGKYKQGKGALKSGNKYCCLGVLCDIVDPTEEKYEWNDPSLDYTLLPIRLAVDVGLIKEKGSYSRQYTPSVRREDEEGEVIVDDLSEMNDWGFDFNTIADYIEAQL